jgi:GNAT superfamily N-acetyltransferase
MKQLHSIDKVTFKSLKRELWCDFEKLFGDRGGCAGCWCMFWRLAHSQFERQKGNKNRLAMKSIVESGKAPGILAYIEGKPVGWCAVARREEFIRLEGSRILHPIDDKRVWSIVCLFVARHFRRCGISVALLKAAAKHVHQCGGRIVEGYPVEPKKGSVPDVFVWTGLASAFREAGFIESARRSPTRPIMRRVVS